MYTEQDMAVIRRRIRKYAVITIVLVAVLLAGYVIGMQRRMELWVMVDAALIFSVLTYMFGLYLYPCMRYKIFLRDMKEGLAREVEGTIVEISEKEENQDGVRVLPVRICLKADQDERIIYLNASKTEHFPKAGTEVRLNCYGRHIKEVLA